MSKIKIINKNESGRDFICSDIHGHFYLLDQNLKDVQFNPKVDRLFCLGDLIDRSDDSIQVLEYLSKPWFYSILGNHEIMLIEAYEGNDSGFRQQWYFWGGDWAEQLTDDELYVYYQNIVKLPLAIELQLDSGKRVGLVHANLPDKADWNDIKVQMSKLPESGVNSYEPLLREMLWNKAPIYENYSINLEAVSHIDHVFHGHTIVDDYIVLENRTYMDLGSYSTYKLGFVQPDLYLQNMN